MLTFFSVKKKSCEIGVFGTLLRISRADRCSNKNEKRRLIKKINLEYLQAKVQLQEEYLFHGLVSMPLFGGAASKKNPFA